METGIFNISNEEYHEAEGISRSGIMELKKSAAHYANKYRNPNKIEVNSTPQMMIGSAVHAYVLEPKDFKERYFVADKQSRVSNAGKAYMAQMEIEAAGRIFLSTEEFNEVEKIGIAFLNNDIARQFLDNAKIEQSLFWRDKHSDVLCKARPDIWLSNMTGDIKTCTDGSPQAFQRDIVKYGYHIQAAMMHDAVEALTGAKLTEHVCIAIEKAEPYAVGIYMLDNAAIEKGREEYKNLLMQYKEHEARKEWSGYKPTIVSLPAWYY